jgi:hypothetical protein
MDDHGPDSQGQAAGVETQQGLVEAESSGAEVEDIAVASLRERFAPGLVIVNLVAAGKRVTKGRRQRALEMM